MSGRLAGKRVLLTQADDYMGPVTVEVFEREGATVIADTRDLTEAGACEAAVAEAGHIDVLMANLASPTFTGIAATELGDDEWRTAFAIMVDSAASLVARRLAANARAQGGQDCRLRQCIGLARHENVGRLQCCAWGATRLRSVSRRRSRTGERAN